MDRSDAIAFIRGRTDNYVWGEEKGKKTEVGKCIDIISPARICQLSTLRDEITTHYNIYPERIFKKIYRKALNQISVSYVIHDNTKRYWQFRSLKNAANLEYTIYDYLAVKHRMSYNYISMQVFDCLNIF